MIEGDGKGRERLYSTAFGSGGSPAGRPVPVGDDKFLKVSLGSAHVEVLYSFFDWIPTLFWRNQDEGKSETLKKVETAASTTTTATPDDNVDPRPLECSPMDIRPYTV